MELDDASRTPGLSSSVFQRLFRRPSAKPGAPARSVAAPPLPDARRRQTDAILASLTRNEVLFPDEFDLADVYEHVRCNGPEGSAEPIGFEEVIGSVAYVLDPLTNLVFIPVWSELTATDVEEFTESICWLAGINTNAVALPVDTQATDKPATDKPATDKPATDKPAFEPSDRTVVHPALTLAVRFELDPGHMAELEVQVPPKGLPEGLIEGLAALVDDRVAPRRLVETLCGSDIVISALDPESMLAVNTETGADYRPSRGRPGDPIHAS